MYATEEEFVGQSRAWYRLVSGLGLPEEAGDHALCHLSLHTFDGKWRLSVVCGCGASSDTPYSDWFGATAAALTLLALSAPEALELAIPIARAIEEDRRSHLGGSL